MAQGVPVTSGLVLHLDADAITGLSDADPVPQWDDLSGEDNHATQGMAGNRPTYKTDILNGLPVVRFDGTNSFLEIAHDASLSTTAGITIFIIKRSANLHAGMTNHLIHKRLGLDTNYEFRVGRDGVTWSSASDELDFFVNADGTTGGWSGNESTNVSLNAGAWYLLAAIYDNTDFHLWADGDEKNTGHLFGTASANMIANTHPVMVGAYPAADNYFDGDIAEILLYDRVLTTSEREDVESYLDEKWFQEPSETVAGGMGIIEVVGLAGTPVAGAASVSGVLGVIEVAGLAGSAVAGTVTVSGALGTIEISGLAGSPAAGAVSIAGATGTVEVTGLSGAPVAGAASVAGSLGTIAITGLAGEPVDVPPDVVAGTLGIVEVVGIAGAPVAGAVTVTGAIGTIEITGLAGTPSAEAPPVQGGLGVVEVIGLSGQPVAGAAAVSGQRGTIEIAGLSGQPQAGGVTVTGATGVVEIIGLPGGPSSVAVVSGALGAIEIVGLSGSPSAGAMVIGGATGVVEIIGLPGLARDPGIFFISTVHLRARLDRTIQLTARSDRTVDMNAGIEHTIQLTARQDRTADLRARQDRTKELKAGI